MMNEIDFRRKFLNVVCWNLGYFMELKDLKPNIGNPRKITDKKLIALKNAMMEFGDLSGIVFNRRSKQLVGGHQRLKSIPRDAQITIEWSNEDGTKTGTVAEGYITIDGENFSYREVDWDEAREKAANIAANKGAGEWDESRVIEYFCELDQFNFDLDFTMFDKKEIQELFKDSEEKPIREKKKRVEKCPNCHTEFIC